MFFFWSFDGLVCKQFVTQSDNVTQSFNFCLCFSHIQINIRIILITLVQVVVNVDATNTVCSRNAYLEFVSGCLI